MNLRYALFVTVLSGMLASTAALAQTPPAPTHIGIVNLGKVFRSVQEMKDIQAKQEADSNSLKTLANQHQADLDVMKQELRNGPKPDSEDWDKKLTALETKSVEYDSDLKLRQAEMSRIFSKQLKAVFDKVQASVAEIAKQKGLDLVLTENLPDPAPGTELTPDQMAQLLAQHNVLFAGGNIDITDEVIAALDAQYKAGTK
jgi:Skp family chaperone for outer membrane proteins